MSIMSDAPTPRNGGKWELTYWMQCISSHLPPLGGVDAFDMIDIVSIYIWIIFLLYFSIGLVYLMYRAFDEVCIHKPNTSRPANSERYIICKGKRPDVEAIRDYMFKINSRLNQLGFSQLGVTKSNVDVNEIVPLSLIFEDKEFAEYMRQSNDIIGR